MYKFSCRIFVVKIRHWFTRYFQSITFKTVIESYHLPSPMRFCGHLWLNISFYLRIYITLLLPHP